MNYILHRSIGLAFALCCAQALAQATDPAQPAEPPPEKPAPIVQPAPVGDHNTTLADQLPPEQVLWLETEPPEAQAAPTPAPPAPQAPAILAPTTAAPNTAQPPAAPEPEPATRDTGRFLARHVPDLTGEPRGAVIILHDSEQHPSWPFTVDALVDDLPQHGWNTIAIELPAPAQDAHPLKPLPPPIPPAPAPQETAEAPATNPAAPAEPAAAPAPEPAPAVEPPPPPTPEQQAQARIAAALRYLTQDTRQPPPVVIIGFGSGAYRAVEFARQLASANAARSTKPLAALALIAPRNSLPAGDRNLPSLLPETGLPTLDMILNSDAQARADAEARRRAVLHQRERVYQRIEIPPLNGAAHPDHSVLVKRVRGFLQQQVGKTPDKRGGGNSVETAG